MTSPSVEKAGDDVTPAAPMNANGVTPVQDAAPQIDEPLKNKPIDTAAVIAPVDSAIATHDSPANGVHAQTTIGSPPSKSPSTPSPKGGVMGFFKRQDSRLEVCALLQRILVFSDSKARRKQRLTNQPHHQPPRRQLLLPKHLLLLYLKVQNPNAGPRSSTV